MSAQKSHKPVTTDSNKRKKIAMIALTVVIIGIVSALIFFVIPKEAKTKSNEKLESGDSATKGPEENTESPQTEAPTGENTEDDLDSGDEEAEPTVTENELPTASGDTSILGQDKADGSSRRLNMEEDVDVSAHSEEEGSADEHHSTRGNSSDSGTDSEHDLEGDSEHEPEDDLEKGKEPVVSEEDEQTASGNLGPMMASHESSGLDSDWVNVDATTDVVGLENIVNSDLYEGEEEGSITEIQTPQEKPTKTEQPIADHQAGEGEHKDSTKDSADADGAPSNLADGDLDLDTFLSPAHLDDSTDVTPTVNAPGNTSASGETERPSYSTTNQESSSLDLIDLTEPAESSEPTSPKIDNTSTADAHVDEGDQAETSTPSADSSTDDLPKTPTLSETPSPAGPTDNRDGSSAESKPSESASTTEPTTQTEDRQPPAQPATSKEGSTGNAQVAEGKIVPENARKKETASSEVKATDDETRPGEEGEVKTTSPDAKGEENKPSPTDGDGQVGEDGRPKNEDTEKE